MMWKDLDRVYFIGVGGIGMSALARYFLSQGKHVAGYDRVSTPLTEELVREGIEIHFEDDEDLIPLPFRRPEACLVVYTPAVPDRHRELNYFRTKGFRITKRAAALGEVFNSGRGIGVAGTHGKTSISTILTHIVSRSELGCNAFLGGIGKNSGSNFHLDPDSELMIAEADEFDRSFLALCPEIAVLSSMDADHLDIYGDEDSIRKGFEAYIAQIRKGGKLVIKTGLEAAVPPGIEVFSYGLSGEEADYRALGLQPAGVGYRFQVEGPGLHIPDVLLPIPGLLQVENALAAVAVCHQLGLSSEQIVGALADFQGVVRRFDMQLNKEKHIYIDDYAHHPEEIRAFLASVRKRWPGKKLTGIFQPHLFSRTKDFAGGFAKSLGMLDALILLDIYPAREEPMPGVDAGLIFAQVELEDKLWIRDEELLSVIAKRKPELLVSMGAGDISRFVAPIKELLNKET